MSNPFVLVHRALWDAIEAHPYIASTVKRTNKIKHDGRSDYRDPAKENIKDGDLPELRIVKTGGEGNLKVTTSSAEKIQRFDIYLKTGEHQTVMMDNLDWAIYQALSKWITEAYGLLLLGETFVHDVSFVSSIEGIVDSRPVDTPEEPEGWGCITSISVRMRFSKKQLDFANFTPMTN